MSRPRHHVAKQQHRGRTIEPPSRKRKCDKPDRHWPPQYLKRKTPLPVEGDDKQ